MSVTLKRMVAGFLFNQDRTQVVLIRKDKPHWQRGLLNGVGGKLEKGETHRAAMIREFYEETGVEPAVCVHWMSAVYMGDDRTWGVTFFYGVNQEAFIAARTMENEEVVKVRVADIWCYHTVPNLRWLIPFCLDLGIVKPVTMIDRTP